MKRVLITDHIVPLVGGMAILLMLVVAGFGVVRGSQQQSLIKSNDITNGNVGVLSSNATQPQLRDNDDVAERAARNSAISGYYWMTRPWR